MTKKEYLLLLEKGSINSSRIQEVQKIYKNELPEIIKKIVSYSENSIFFDDGYRVLSFQEIIDAEHDLHIGFAEMNIIPIMDCGENDFIVYHLKSNMWSKFNIIDESVFKKKTELNELL